MTETVYIPSDNELDVFKHCHNQRLPLLIKGPTGCGKSQFVQHMAERLDVPLVKVACNEDTNAADLLGRFLLKGAETIWQDGPVTRAARTGAILYLDEIAEAREDVVVALHPLTDHRREVYLDKIDQTVKASDRFMCVASYNPGYQRGFRELKPSTRQRFVNLTLDYLPPESETRVLTQLTGIDGETANRLIRLALKVRSLKDMQLKATVSTRLLVHAANLIKDGMNPRRAAHAAIASALSDDAEITAALIDLVNLAL